MTDFTPAFPTIDCEHGGETNGMTLRDYFAAKAMQGLIANGSVSASIIAMKAYEVADAMLKMRVNS